MTEPHASSQSAQPVHWWAKQSLHQQMSWIHGLLILLLLMVFSAALYLTAKNLLYSDLDHQLHRDAEAAQQALIWSGRSWQERVVSHPEGDPFDTDPFFEVWSTDGVLEYTSITQATLARKAQSLRLGRPGNERQYFSLQAVDSPNSSTLRVGVEPMRIAQRDAVLRVYRSERALKSQLSRLALGLAAALVLIAALAAWLSWFFTRRALMPLQALVQSLEQTQSPAHWLAMDMRQRPSSSEVQALLRSIEGLGERLRESYAQLDGFAAQCAHELRTPLSALQTRCEWLLRSGQPPQRDELGALLEQIDRMALLVDRLLSLAHTPAQIAAERMGRIDLGQLTERVVANMRPVLEEREQTLLLQSAPAWTHTDAVLVEQILMDLLHNASLYAPARSVVAVEVTASHSNPAFFSEPASSSTASISITDSGFGPASTWLERAGIPWQGQAPSPGSAAGLAAHGTGLGLRFVARTMHLLGGSIQADYVNREPAKPSFSLILSWKCVAS
jgi:signal transduction histidine kinase